MDKSDIMTQLKEIVSEVFEVDPSVVDENTSAKDIDNWDSIAHVLLISTAEKKFGVRFSSREIAGFQCIGDLKNGIEKKLS